MDTSRIIRQKRMEIRANLVAGVVLLLAGLLLAGFKVQAVPNPKAVFALGFIPLGLAFSSWVMLNGIQKRPEEMKDIIVSINDERLAAARNQAEAAANRVFRWLVCLVFLGYSLIVPGDVFRAIGWWLILVLFCLSYVLPLVAQILVTRSSDGDDNDALAP